MACERAVPPADTVPFTELNASVKSWLS